MKFLGLVIILLIFDNYFAKNVDRFEEDHENGENSTSHPSERKHIKVLNLSFIF